MKYALDTCGWSGHLTSDTVTQEYRDAGNIGGVKPEACWKANEPIVRQLLVTSVPDSVFNCVKGGARNLLIDSFRVTR